MKKIRTGKSSQNRLSNREFFLVVVLVAVVIGYLLGYQLILPKWTEYQDMKAVNDIHELAVNRQKVDFDKKADYEKELENLKTSIADMKSELPPYMAQEELLILTDRVSAETTLTLNVMSFDTVTVVQDTVYQANAAAAAAGQAATATTPVAATTPAAVGIEDTYLVADQQINLSFQGTYDTLYAFLKKMEQNVRKVFPRDLVISVGDAGLVSGTMRLSFLSYVDVAKMEAYQFDLQMTPGRTDPFKPYYGYVSSSDLVESQQVALGIPDFSFKLNNYLDNAPKVILDAVNDTAGSVSSEENIIHTAKLVISGNDKTFSHTLTLDGTAVSSGSVKEIRNGTILIYVIAQPLRDDKDLVGLVLDIDNKSAVPVEIRVLKDDIKIPRFRMGIATGNVTLK